VHVAVVDPGVGSARPILCAEHEGHAFLAPDNGLLGPLLGPPSDSRASVRALELERFSLPQRSRTFHGRDVFAPAAARLACGLPPEGCGPLVPSWRSFAFPSARVLEPGLLEVEVLIADRYGNLVTNAHRADLAPDPAQWHAQLGTRLVPVVGTYAEVAPGDALCLIDSYDLLEIAVRDGDAGAELGLGAGAVLRLRCGA
jgi:S-adenosylmethionine hydrolase